MPSICDELRAAILQALIPDPDKCPEEKRDYLVKLSDLPLIYMRGNGLRKNDVVEKGTRKCVLYGELFTRHTEGKINEADLSETNTISNVLSKSGDILIPGTSTASKEVMLRARELYVDDVQIGGDINIIRPNAELFYPKYMSYVFDTFSSKRQLFEYITGTTGIIHISNSGIKNLIFYLPPIDEQKRIVEKVDELMARVADLEQSADALASLKKAFPDDIKASLLQAAMQGKLTEQLPEDGDAEDLLEEIKAEKENLIAEGKIKKQKPPTSITDDEIPFNIPKNWQWVRFGDVNELISGTDLTPDKYSSKPDGILYITGASNIQNGHIVQNRWTKNASRISKKGDLLLTCKGTVGTTAILDVDEAHIARQIMAIRPIRLNVNYIKFFIDYMVPTLKSAAKSMIPGIERGNVLNMLLPLPPLAEQKRIVERLDTLMQNINVVGELIASE